MKILVVDDERTFTFKREGIEVDHARSSEEAIKKLTENRYMSIWLDHDLGRDDTGMKVAEFLRDNRKMSTIRNVPIYVHSMNPVGSQNMVKTMNFGREGFTSRAKTIDLGTLGHILSYTVERF